MSAHRHPARRLVGAASIVAAGLGLSFTFAPSPAGASRNEPGCVQQVVQSEINGVLQTVVKCLLGSPDTTAASTIPAVRKVEESTTTAAPAPTPTAAPTPGPSPTAAPAPTPAPAAAKAAAKKTSSKKVAAAAPAAAPAAPADAPAELAAVDVAATNLPVGVAHDSGINWGVFALILFAGAAAIVAAGGAINRHVRMVRDLRTAAGPRYQR